MKKLISILTLCSLAACGGGSTDSADSAAPQAGSDLPDTYHAAAADAAAVDVFALRESGKDGQDVVVKGTVQDIAERFASLTLFDASLEDCTEVGEEDHCATPWDYCCEDPAKIKSGQIAVEFLDGDEPGGWQVKGFHGLDLLSEVVVSGKLHVDAQNNMRIAAASVHVAE